MLESSESALSVGWRDASALESPGNSRGELDSGDLREQKDIAAFQVGKSVNKVRARLINVALHNRAAVAETACP